MIRTDGIKIQYPDGTIGLHPTTVAFHEREITVLLGLSGAGKSTLLRSLNHLVVPADGMVTVDGIGPLNSRRRLRDHRRRTAMIFQQHQLIGRYTALQNVLTGRLGLHPTWRTLFPFPRADRLLALDCLDRVGLADRALSRADGLSGGQQQRVGIARALAQQPKLILADEPVASLDPATSERVMGQLRDICKQDGIPAVVSLHQLELARDFADRIIGLNGGRVVFDGRPDALTEAPLHAIYGRAEPASKKTRERFVTLPHSNPELEPTGCDP